MEREATDSGERCQSRPAAPASAEGLARLALGALGEAALVFDGAGRLCLANGAAVDLVGPTAVEGALLHQVLAGIPPLAEMARVALGAGASRAACEVPPREGDARRLVAHAVPLPWAPGACLLTVRALVDERGERELWQAEKMAALGRLASSVAHEVRNPLGAVDIQLQLLAEDARTLGGELADRLVERVDRARAEMRRLDGIVQNFLRFSRPPAVRLEPTDPAHLVQRMHDLVAPEARARGIDLRLELRSSLPWVRADENVLSQALLNVLINAFQAVAEDGTGRVDLGGRVDGSDRVLLEVGDNGCGIPADDLERVLEYYYTTKDTGTGLGLSIAQGILRQHGGSLRLASRVGAGTTVTFDLPACLPPPGGP